MGRALAAPAAGQGYSRSLLHIPVMGPWDPNKSEEKVRQTHPNYGEQETLFGQEALFRHKSKSTGEFVSF